MHFPSVARLALIAGVAGVAAMAVAPAAMARKPPVIEAPPMPPPPPPMPEVSLAHKFVAAAGAYDDYVHQASSISPAFADAGGVGQSLRAGSAYEPGQLRVGAVAYAAIAVLTDEAFVNAVRASAPLPDDRYALVRKIFSDPKAALQFADGTRAAGIAKHALMTGGLRLYDAGNSVRLAAYSMQHEPWSLQTVPDLDSRADAVKRLSNSPRSTPGSETQTLDLMVAGERPAGAALDPAPGPYTGLVVRAVALAALAAIGQADDEIAPHLGWLTDDYYLDHCLAEAKLAEFECLAVARPNYEDVFCLGQHAMKDTGACVVISAGGAVPIDIMTKPLAVPPARMHPAPTRRRRHST
ncbi:MAG TPA: hypothetical protein VHS81_02290 [Caulobacteraceae bacterium]|nr:hypothetical protein [Caulobacteraceae bacterium]